MVGAPAKKTSVHFRVPPLTTQVATQVAQRSHRLSEPQVP